MRVVVLTTLFLMSLSQLSARPLSVYIGTYTKTSSQGIYVASFDDATGRLGELSLAATVANPSFLAVSADTRRLYAVSEGDGAQFHGKPCGLVHAFCISPENGHLAALNQAVSGGSGPCNIALAPDSRHVAVANYGGGSVALLNLSANGHLQDPADVIQHEGHGAHPNRQKGPHVHSATFSPDGRFVVTANLGTDKLTTYRVDASAGPSGLARASELVLPPGSGPRHFAFHPDGRHAFAISELANTVSVLSYDAVTGALALLEAVPTLPADFTGKNTTAEIAVHPNGRFVYGSNRGHDSIAIFTFDSATGKLTPAGHVSTEGKGPRHFSLDPSGRWLIAANQNSGTLVVFAINPDTGALTPTGQTAAIATPVCVRFLPALSAP